MGSSVLLRVVLRTSAGLERSDAIGDSNPIALIVVLIGETRWRRMEVAAVRLILTLTLSADHRVAGGAHAANLFGISRSLVRIRKHGRSPELDQHLRLHAFERISSVDQMVK